MLGLKNMREVRGHSNNNDLIKPILMMMFFMSVLLIIANFDYFKYRKSANKPIYWKKGFEVNKIDIVSITLGFQSTKTSKKQVRYWKKAKKVYVNNQMVKYESLFRWKDFMYKHCEDYYVLLPLPEIDSIVYNFKKNIYEEYNSDKKLLNSSDYFSSKKTYQKRNIRDLPECK